MITVHAGIGTAKLATSPRAPVTINNEAVTGGHSPATETLATFAPFHHLAQHRR
jgi:hypothetical protein